MILYINTTAQSPAAALVSGLPESPPTPPPDFIFGDKLSIDIYLVDGLGNYDPRSGDAANTLRVALGPIGGPNVAYQATWTPIANGYRGTLNLNTSEASTLLGTSESVTTWLEVELNESSGARIGTVVHMEVLLRREIIPESPQSPTPVESYTTTAVLNKSFIQNRFSIDGLVGGTGTKLDGIVTASGAVETGTVVEFVLNDVLYFYRLENSTHAEQSPGWIRPDDYNNPNNARVWILRQVSTFAEPGSATTSPGLTIGYIPDIIVEENDVSTYVEFPIDDVETTGASLVVTADADDTELIPLISVVFGADNDHRKFRIFPAANYHGQTFVTVTLEDAAGNTTSRIISVLVHRNHDVLVFGSGPPEMSDIADVYLDVDQESDPIDITISDAIDPSGDLGLSAIETSNPALIATTGIAFGGSGGARLMVITPEAGESGSAFIRIRCTDLDGHYREKEFTVYVGQREPVTGLKTLSVNTTQVGNVGTGEDDLMSYSVPKHRLGTTGDALLIECCGAFAANGNNKRLKAKFGSTTMFDTTALALNAGNWTLRMEIIRTGAATQRAHATFVSSNATLGYSSAISTPAETLANAITLKLTGEATSNDDITQNSMSVRFLPA